MRTLQIRDYKRTIYSKHPYLKQNSKLNYITIIDALLLSISFQTKYFFETPLTTQFNLGRGNCSNAISN